MRKVLLILFLSTLPVLLSATQLYAQQAFVSRGGLPSFFKKMEAGGAVSAVYLGGSITQAAGYRVKSATWLQQKYPSSKVQAINAGVGGTGSDLGVFRVPEDVLSHHPDLVFVEFAVNDYGADSARTARSVEGIIRQVKLADPNTDICLLYTISEAMLGDYQAGVLPASVRIMERLANHYELPSVNFASDVLAMRQSGQLIFHGKISEYPQKVVFTTDGTHPLDRGHEIYLATLKVALEAMAQMKGASPHGKALPTAMDPGFLSQTARYLPLRFNLSPGWKAVASTDPLRNFLPALPGLCYADHEKDSLLITFKGTAFGVEDVIGPASNGFLIQIDGGKPFKITRFDKYCSRYRRHYFLVDGLVNEKHKVVIRPDFMPLDKLAILKPEDRRIFDQQSTQTQRMYVGSILIAGKVLPNLINK